jgi:hypothetical protein
MSFSRSIQWYHSHVDPILGRGRGARQRAEDRLGGGGGVNLREGCDQGASRYKGLTNTF